MSFVPRIFFVLSLFLATALAQNHTGTLFNFVPGLGACGFTNTSTQFVGSVSSEFFSSFPGATANPNDNPICTHNFVVTSGNISVTAQIVDFFVQGDEFNVGLSTTAFEKFATLDQGVVNNVTWSVL